MVVGVFCRLWGLWVRGRVLFCGDWLPFWPPFAGGLCCTLPFYCGSIFDTLFWPLRSLGFYLGASFWLIFAFDFGYYFAFLSAYLPPFLASLPTLAYGLAFFYGYFLRLLSAFYGYFLAFLSFLASLASGLGCSF